MSSEIIQFYDTTAFTSLDDLDLFDGVFQYFPKIFKDDRGSFTEVYNRDSEISDFINFNKVVQVNRSTSIPCVCRGMHAQTGDCCQAKFIECIHGTVVDFIIDARQSSKTFKNCYAFILDSTKANKVFVPKGFLHGFYVPTINADGSKLDKAIFQYYIYGGTYYKASEINVSIDSTLRNYFYSNILPNLENTKIADDFCKNYIDNKLILSEKDKNGLDIEEWFSKISDDWYTE